MPNLIGNLLFEHLDKFQAYSSSACEKVAFGILQIKWVFFHNLNVFFMTNLICQKLSFMFNIIHSCPTFLVQEQPQKRRLVELI